MGMIVDCAHYLDGRRQGDGNMSLQEAAEQCRRGGFVWVGLFEPSREEMDEAKRSFGLHELAVEDAETVHQRPKLEEYDRDVHLVILRTARYDDEREELDFGEISVFLGPSFVITVRQGAAGDLRSARTRLEHRPALLDDGSFSALWAVMDQVVDSYAPIVTELERDIEQVEATVFSGEVAPTERIYSLRREVADFYRAVHPLLAVVVTAERRMRDTGLLPYFRDIREHLLMVSEDIAAQRDVLATVFEANLTVISVEQTKISVRQNASMEQLTRIATVFLPLTFVTGFFGQNFGWLVDHIDGPWEFLLYGIGGLLLPCLLLYMWFRRQRPAAD